MFGDLNGRSRSNIRFAPFDNKERLRIDGLNSIVEKEFLSACRLGRSEVEVRTGFSSKDELDGSRAQIAHPVEDNDISHSAAPRVKKTTRHPLDAKLFVISTVSSHEKSATIASPHLSAYASTL